MLSLIVALDTPPLPGGALRYALSREAAPGVERTASADGDSALPEHGSTPLALLPRAGELVAVVPARLLSWHRVTLPKVSPARLRSVLDGMLEDRLLEDAASVHFAVAPGAAQGAVWVAACNRAWLRQALQAFEAAGRPVSRIVPEFTPLADGQAPLLQVMGTPEQPELVRCADDGVQLLPLSHGAFDALGLATAPGTWVADPAVAGVAEQLLGQRLPLQHAAQRLVAAARSDWDLAQFDLASTGRTRLVRRLGMAWAQWMGSPEWRPARWGLAVLLMAQLVGLNAWAWKERSDLQAKRSQVRQILTQTFPRVPVVVDAPAQMDNEVAVLRQATGAVSSRDLEPMLAAVADNARSAPAPSALDFTRGELTLKGFQPPPAEAAGLPAALAAAGFTARADGDGWVVQSASPSLAGQARQSRPAGPAVSGVSSSGANRP